MDNIVFSTAAAYEAAGREMRAVINSHSETRARQIEAAEAAQRRRTRAAEARAKREREYYAVALRVCLAIIFAATMCLWNTVGAVNITTCTVGVILAIGYAFIVTAAYALRIRKERAASWEG